MFRKRYLRHAHAMCWRASRPTCCPCAGYGFYLGIMSPTSLLSSFIPLSFMLFDIVIEFDVELPPAKRRRTLAGSIVSTALSAALIGTAVGLTVYRL